MGISELDGEGAMVSSNYKEMSCEIHYLLSYLAVAGGGGRGRMGSGVIREREKDTRLDESSVDWCLISI